MTSEHKINAFQPHPVAFSTMAMKDSPKIATMSIPSADQSAYRQHIGSFQPGLTTSHKILARSHKGAQKRSQSKQNKQESQQKELHTSKQATKAHTKRANGLKPCYCANYTN